MQDKLKTTVASATNLENVQKKIGTVGKKAYNEVKSNVQGLISSQLVAIAGTTALILALATMRDNAEQAYKAIVVGTGAAGESLNSMLIISRELHAENVQGFKTVAMAVADVNTRLNYADEDLSKFAGTVLKLNQITGEGTTPIITNASKAINAWGIAAEDSSFYMDKLFTVSQSTGISFTTLTSQMGRYSGAFETLGFTFEESAAILGQFEKSGIGSTRALMALNMASTQLAKDGMANRKGINMLVEAIKGAETQSQAAAIAAQYFGTTAGVDMAKAIRQGVFDVDMLTAAMEESEGKISDTANETETFRESLTKLKNTIETDLQPVISVMNKGLKLVTDNWGIIAPIVYAAAGALTGVAVVIGVVAAGAALAAIGVSSSAIIIALAIGAVIGVIGYAITKFDKFKESAVSAFDAVKNAASGLPLIGGWFGGGEETPAPATIPAYAGGTSFHSGGPAIVGERGPELVNLPRGSSVMTASETKQALSGGGGNVYIDTVNIPIDKVDSISRAIDMAENFTLYVQLAMREMNGWL